MVELTTPVVVPAVPEVTYPIAWYRNIKIKSNGPTEGTVSFERVPCTVGFELHPTETTQFRVVNLWEMCAEVPEAATAMTAIIAAMPKIEEWLAAQV